MCAAIRQAKVKTGMAEELARRIKEGAIPIISDVEGFLAHPERTDGRMKFVIFGPWALGCDIIRESPGMSPGLLVKGRPLRFSKPGERKFNEISSPCRLRAASPASVPSSSAVRRPSPRW